MVLVTVLHIPLCFFFLRWLDWGILGLAIATSIKDLISLIMVLVYCRCSFLFKQTLQPIDSEAFTGWGAYLKVSLPATVMMCGEWWAFEIFIVLAGTLGVKELAAFVISNNVN